MSDPLSIASGVAGLVSLGATLAKGLNQYYSSWKDCDANITATLKSLESLTSTLAVVQKAVDQTAKDSTALNQLTASMNNCRIGLQNLQNKYDKIVYTTIPSPTSNAAQKPASAFANLRISVKNQSIRALYPFKESTLVKLREIVRELVAELNTILTLLNVEETRSVHVDVKELVLIQKNEERKKIAQWISPTNFTARHAAILSTRHPDTGGFLLNSTQFEEWIQGKHKTLFCPGIPGAGKTVMAASVVDHLQRKYLSNTSVSVCYVYCDFHDQKKQTLEFFLACILEQLVWSLPSLPKVLRRSYMDHERDRTCPPAAEMVNLFRECCSAMDKVFIVADALDECDGTTKVFKQLSDKLSVLATSAAAVRVLATSRFIPEIMQYYEKSVSLEIRAQKEDVERYIAGRMLDLPTCVQRNDQLRKDISLKVVDVVDGMFLLAKLHLDSLQEKRTPKAIRNILGTLKRGSQALNAAYTEAKERIERQSSESIALSKTILAWITLAERPLTATELQHALGIEPGIPFDDDNIIEMEDILSVCAGLVALDPSTQIVRFFHFTAQEYFEKLMPTWHPTARVDVARTCLYYLLDNDFANGQSSTQTELEARLQEHPLLDFACCFWGTYAKNDMSALGSQLPLQLVRDLDKVACAVEVSLRPTQLCDSWADVPRDVSGLHLASGLGLDRVVEELLNKDQHPADELDSKRRSPLSWAAERGQEGCVRLLLARSDVEPDSRDHNGCTPLAWASRFGHVGIVLALLDHSVEADTPDKFDQTPLSWASEYGKEDVVKVLLRQPDISADSRDITGQTPFSWAARRGQIEVMKLLLDLPDVEVDSFDNMGQTPLSRAARAGEEAAIAFLLASTSAEPDCADNEGMTPLSWAAKCGHEGTVKLLVDRDDVEADSKDLNGQTPFWWAARRGHEAVVVLLSKRSDVDTDIENYDGQTPLSMAAECGMDAVVTYLVDTCGVNVESRDQGGQTPLSWAARCGQDGAVRLLMDRADKETKDNEGRTPLAWAKIRNHQMAIDILSA